MFDRMTKRIAERMGQTAKAVAEPIKTEVTQKVDNKVDLYSRILRLGVLVFLFIDGTKRVTTESRPEPMNNSSPPNRIVINNYIQEPYRRPNNRQHYGRSNGYSQNRRIEDGNRR